MTFSRAEMSWMSGGRATVILLMYVSWTNGATSGSFSVRMSMRLRWRFRQTSSILSTLFPGDAVIPMLLVPFLTYLETFTYA